MQAPRSEAALYAALRALQEQEAVMRRLVAAQATGSPGAESNALLLQADQLLEQIEMLRRFVERPGGD